MQLENPRYNLTARSCSESSVARQGFWIVMEQRRQSSEQATDISDCCLLCVIHVSGRFMAGLFPVAVWRRVELAYND